MPSTGSPIRQERDEDRDARRYHDLLRTLRMATQHIRRTEEQSPDVDAILAAALPDLAQALSATMSFAAVLRQEPSGVRYFDITVSHPSEAYLRQRIEWCEPLADLIESGEPIDLGLADAAHEGSVPELSPLPACSAIVVRLAMREEQRIVGICHGQGDAGAAFLSYDRLALDQVIELIAIGLRAGERRAQELRNIQAGLEGIGARLEKNDLLPIIAEHVRQTFKAAAISLMFWDAAKECLKIDCHIGLPDDYVRNVRVPRADVERLRHPDGSYQPVVIDLVESPVVPAPLVQMTGLGQVRSIPLWQEGELIGALNVYFVERDRPFSDPERALADIFARELGIAVHYAQLYQDSRLQTEHWRALHKASKALVEGFTLKREDLFEQVVRQAVDLVTGVHRLPAELGVIQLYDGGTGVLKLACVYPRARWEDLLDHAPRERNLKARQASGQRVGVTGRAVLEGKPQLVGDVDESTDYVVFFQHTRSELAVPLKDRVGDREEIIGVLSVESSEPNTFDEYDVLALEGLADIAVIVHKLFELQDQLRRNTTVALMGAWQATITHDAGRPISAIRRKVGILKGLKGMPAAALPVLQQIDDAAGELTMPSMPQSAPTPGRGDKGDCCGLDLVIRKEVELMRRNDASITWDDTGLACGDTEVLIHDQWLRAIVRHLTRNAWEAAQKVTAPRVWVRSWRRDGVVHVQVEDNGPGIDPEVSPLLFVAPIGHEDGRQGRGLLLVRCLAEAHGGDAAVAEKQMDGSGSCFEFWAPIAGVEVSV